MKNRIKILLIDHDPIAVSVLQSCLESDGYEVITANSGKTAVELFYKIKPTLVIIDLVLPDIEGENVCKEIRKNSNVPLIVATGKSDEASILSCYSFGIDDYVTKPFSPRQLAARVKAALRRAGVIGYSA